jgi:sugar porter (SP) family MFS transporter
MYIAEIAPARLRGRLGTSFQLNIVAGILISYFSNYLISQTVTNDAWRWMLGVESIPAIIFIVLVLFIPESPRWLVLQSKINEAASILKNIHPHGFARELKEIQESIQIKEGVPRESLFSRIYFKPIILAVLVALFNQMSGINAVMYYAPRIFEMVGYAQDSALLQSVSVGSTLFIFTIVGMFLVDKVGRKKLLLIGAAGMVFFLAMVAKTVFTTTNGSIWMLIYLSGFIAFFAFSQGTVIWVFISEIFPNSVRAKGQALGSFTHWASAAAISWVFPILAGNHGGGWSFTFFSAAMVIQFIVVWKFFPETKGKSLEQIQNELSL